MIFNVRLLKSVGGNDAENVFGDTSKATQFTTDSDSEVEETLILETKQTKGASTPNIEISNVSTCGMIGSNGFSYGGCFVKPLPTIFWNLIWEMRRFCDCDGFFLKHVSAATSLNMVRNVSNEEVKMAMFSIGDDRAPGPDGFTSAFFKKSWDLVGNDVCSAVKEFFNNGQLLKEINHTFLALIPKVATPLKTFFRVEGITVNSPHLSLNELMHNYHRDRGPPRCAFKVDIQKAYDTVDWKFLSNILSLFGFHKKMVKWIMACVSLASFSLCINGDIHGYFNGKQGLRQGDPISPYLFTLVMEVLTLINKRRVRLSDTFRYHNKCDELELINVFFGEVHSARFIMEALDEFPNELQDGSLFDEGLEIGKTNHYLMRVGFSCVDQCYLLGICFMGCVLVIQYWYYPSIEQLMRGFLWCNGELKRGKAKVAWDIICLPKREGGLAGDGRRKLLQIREFVKPFFLWKKLGNGKSTSLWFDRWNVKCPLINYLTPRDITNEGFTLKTCVADIVSNEGWLWPQSWLLKEPNLATVERCMGSSSSKGIVFDWSIFCSYLDIDSILRRYGVNLAQVMAISVISVSSDSSEDSVGTLARRVILFDTIPTTILDTTPKTGSDPSKDPSSNHIPPLPATLPFLSSTNDTTDSDTPDIPPSPTYGMPFTEITSSTQRSPVIPRRRVMILAPGQPIPHGRPYRYHLNGPVHMMTARKRVGPLPIHLLTVRHSVDHSSLDYFSQDDSTQDYSLDSSSEASSDSIRMLHLILHRDTHCQIILHSIYRVLLRGHLARNVEVDPRETSLRDDAIVRVSDEPHLEQDIDPEIQAEIDECFAYAGALRDKGIDARVVVEAVDREESETGTRGPVEVRVERVTHPVMLEDTPEPAQEGAVEATYETLGDLVQRFHDHTQAIPVHRIQAIEGVQREQGHRIVGVESAVIALTERIAELERDNRRLRGTMSVESQRVDRLQRGMSRMQRELRQMRRLRFYDRVRVGRLEACARKHMGYRP
ncbi:reverse transcriptase domain-containing protein [Tanacetum coccineum]